MTALSSAEQQFGDIAGAARRLGVEPQAVEDLVVANRILYNQGVMDAFGHVSMRPRFAATAFCNPAIWRLGW